MEHREVIAKPGTRPKGGSPQDNFELPGTCCPLQADS